MLSVCALGGVALLSAMMPGPWRSAPSRPASAQGASVRRGPLSITVISSGNLKPADTVRMACAVEGRTTVLAIVPEGTQVKKGEVVCELDASVLEEERIQQTITVGKAEAALVKATQARAIQESQNKSDIDKADRVLAFALQDLDMFLEGDRALELEKSQQSIDLAGEEAQRAQSRLNWSTHLANKGFLTSIELEADRISEHRATVTLQQAKRERELLERYKLPRRESELRAAVEEAKLERERVELQASARLVDFDSDVRSSKASLELEKERLARVSDQIDKAKLRAPSDGYVVYAVRDSDDPPIGAGVEVREREEIVSIPSSDGMLVEVKLHESVLKQVEVGQSCTITVDALPGLVLGGEVKFVAMLPDQNSRWSNPNLRLYRCEVAVTGSNQGLRPGMSCSVEIAIEDLEDALYVPVQAVYRDGMRNVSFVERGSDVEQRVVRVGRYNELWVQILEGLREGETVLLKAPDWFSPAPSTPAPDGSSP